MRGGRGYVGDGGGANGGEGVEEEEEQRGCGRGGEIDESWGGKEIGEKLAKRGDVKKRNSKRPLQ